MNLDNVTAEMRPRGEWESADLGVRMIRRDAAVIYKTWFAITLPMLAVAMAITLATPYAGIAALLYWWFEPVADGALLRILSRRLFGEQADFKATLRATGAIAWRNRLFWLTPYRFHFARSTAMPVTQLEGLSGKARKDRARILNTRIQNFGIGLTTAYQHLALALYIGMILIIYALIPDAYQDTLGTSWLGFFWESETKTAAAVGLLLVYAAQSALQPWFVGAGFGLYINCRTQLEAWDIEVAFRRMAQRRAAASAVVIFLALVIALPLASPTAVAGDAIVETADEFAGYWDAEEVDEAVADVLSDEALEEYTTREQWLPLDRFEQQPETTDDGDLADFGRMLERLFDNIGKILAIIVELSLWIALAALVLLLFLTRRHWLPYVGLSRVAPRARQTVVIADGEIAAESLPDDVPGAAMALWKRGDQRAALGLLYRASVFAAVNRFGVRLPDYATEGVCIRAVQADADTDFSSFFSTVTNAWIWIAYGSRPPPKESFESLCQRWSDVVRTAT